LIKEGETVNVGTVACTIDTDQKPEKKTKIEDKNHHTKKRTKQ